MSHPAPSGAARHEHVSHEGSRSVTEAAYRRLRRDLMNGALPPGSRLKINDLCQTTGINVSAIREALSKLSSEGFVIAQPQRGFRAAPISPDDLQDLTWARVEIETICLRRSMELGDVAWETAVVGAAYAMQRTPRASPTNDPEGYARWCKVHEAFHHALCSACGSEWLLRIRDTLYGQSERYRQMSTRFAGSRRAASDEHEALAQAVLARDAAKTTKIIAAHFQITAADLLDALRQIAPAADRNVSVAGAGALPTPHS